VGLLGIKPYLLPAPTRIWADFLRRADTVGAATLVTTYEILGGYFLAVAVSIPLALAVAYSRFLETSVYPVVVFLQIIPKIAIAPLFIIWFGFGYFPKLLIVFLLSFFPIVVSSIAGFKSVDPEIMDSRERRVRALEDVRAHPTAAGPAGDLHGPESRRRPLRHCASWRVRRVRPRLGYLLLQYNGNLDTPMVFAIIVVLSAIGLALYYAVELIEKLTIPWHVSQNGAGPTPT